MAQTSSSSSVVSDQKTVDFNTRDFLNMFVDWIRVCWFYQSSRFESNCHGEIKCINYTRHRFELQINDTALFTFLLLDVGRKVLFLNIKFFFHQLKLYQLVIEDVVTNVRDAFLDEGVDEQVLQEMKQIWTNRLMASKAVEATPEPLTPQSQPSILANNPKVSRVIKMGRVKFRETNIKKKVQSLQSTMFSLSITR